MHQLVVASSLYGPSLFWGTAENGWGKSMVAAKTHESALSLRVQNEHLASSVTLPAASPESTLKLSSLKMPTLVATTLAAFSAVLTLNAAEPPVLFAGERTNIDHVSNKGLW